MRTIRSRKSAIKLMPLVVVLALACQHSSFAETRWSSPLTLNPSSINFGTVSVGNGQSQHETITNDRDSTLIITRVTATGTGFAVSDLVVPLTLASGQSAVFTVTFAPHAGGKFYGGIAINYKRRDDDFGWRYRSMWMPLSGTGIDQGQLTASPISMNFGSLQVGSTQARSGTLTNAANSPVTITQANVTGTGFSISGLTLPLILATGQSTTFSVAFAPKSGGSATGYLSVTSDASNSALGVPLSGTGVTVGSLSASSSQLSFTSVQVGTSQTLSETLTNSGGSSVTITQANVTGTGFSISGLTLPLILATGQSTTFSVAFAPKSSGSATGYLSVTSDASSALGVSLSGTGVTTGSLTAGSSPLSFAGVQVGMSQTLSETLTNSGGSSVTITQANVTGSGFSISGLNLPLTVATGQSTTFSIAFAPQSSGSAIGYLSIASNASDSTLGVPLSGTGITAGSLSASSSALSFAGVQVGTRQTLPETLTNSGGATVTITQANVTGTGFSLSGLSLPQTLTAGQSFTFGAVFSPSSAGSASGSISVVSTASNATLTVPMSGSGTAAGQLTIAPGTLNFAGVVVGTSKSMTATLGATGSSVTISSAATGTSEFALNGLSFPFTIAAGQTASLNVTFTPKASGTASDSASFVSSASNTTAIESLTGSGTPPPQHSVSLSWNPSTSAVLGYNVYRSTSSGGPYSKIDAALDTSTTYTDSTVQSGQTYYYVTTAVDGSGLESTYSNQAQAVIPTP